MGWGDELMLTGIARQMQKRDRRKVQITTPSEKFHDAWLHNPRIAHPHERGSFQPLPRRPSGLRPYIVSKSVRQWRWRAWGQPVGELYLTAEEKAFGEAHAGRVILEPNIKAGASPNKQWGWVRWNKLAWMLQNAGHKVTQIGPVGTPMLEGAEHVVTASMRQAAAVMATARAAVLPEGGLHHVAAAVGTPAVVIFGGFIAPAVTGYTTQQNIFTGEGLGCGMRLPCPHCLDCMEKIKPEDILDRLMELLK